MLTQLANLPPWVLISVFVLYALTRPTIMCAIATLILTQKKSGEIRVQVLEQLCRVRSKPFITINRK